MQIYQFFVCKEYIDLLLHDYRGIDQHQYFGYNMFSKEKHVHGMI